MNTQPAQFKISAHGKPQDTLPVIVTQNDTGEVFGVEIEIPGYGRPVYLERDPQTGHPVLYVSANPDTDDISHKIPLPPWEELGAKIGPGQCGGKCGECGARNAIVNQCRCDPDNLPTKPTVE